MALLPAPVFTGPFTSHIAHLRHAQSRAMTNATVKFPFSCGKIGAQRVREALEMQRLDAEALEVYETPSGPRVHFSIRLSSTPERVIDLLTELNRLVQIGDPFFRREQAAYECQQKLLAKRARRKAWLKSLIGR